MGSKASCSLGHAGANTRLRGLSVFGAERIIDGLETFLRADFFEQTEGSGGDGERFLLVGLRIKAAEAVHLMPNVVGIESASDGDVEMIGRFTLHARVLSPGGRGLLAGPALPVAA